ncbi:sugar phosphate nucleotidyltransferase, partial [Burkholderia stagnalis]
LLADGGQAFKVDAFVEKPDASTAERFVRDSGYYWNSGMFMLKAATYMEELHRHAPEIARQAEFALASAKRDHDFLRLDADAFFACPNVSIDYAVMERTERAAVIATADLGWSDIGSWSALADIADTDAQGNALVGDVFTDSVKNS